MALLFYVPTCNIHRKVTQNLSTTLIVIDYLGTAYCSAVEIRANIYKNSKVKIIILAVA